MSLLQELDKLQGAPTKINLKQADSSDAGSRDVTGKAGADDIGFSSMRNTINSDGEITGSDVADYLERAQKLNDEVETVPFGLEDSDGDIIKVYVNVEQADKFEEELKKLLGVEDDVEEVINKLALDFDIVDVVWPKNDDDDDENSVDLEASGQYDGLSDDDDDGEFDVVAEYDPLSESVEEPVEEDLLKGQSALFKLQQIAANLNSQTPAGIEVATGVERSKHTKLEMIQRHIQEKYQGEAAAARAWWKHSTQADLPIWLREHN